MIHNMQCRRAEELVIPLFERDSTGHDWHHIDRVRRTALFLCEQEGACRHEVELLALLHDVADPKLSAGDGQQRLNDIVDDLSLGEDRERILQALDSISFSKGKTPPSREAAIVCDADRLDAMGAIGIARAFTYGGSTGAVMHLPGKQYDPHMIQDRLHYRDFPETTITHFFDKLLQLKNGMVTTAGRMEAEKRHIVMVAFLEQFFTEWKGKL